VQTSFTAVPLLPQKTKRNKIKKEGVVPSNTTQEESSINRARRIYFRPLNFILIEGSKFEFGVKVQYFANEHQRQGTKPAV